jgi:thiol-disulfide isomerase/thioredoxin
LFIFLAILLAVSATVFLSRGHLAVGFKEGPERSDRPRSGPAKPGQVASPDAILDFTRDLKSPLVLVNFWASWCEPCKKEMPAMKQLEAKFHDQGLRVILVSIDDEEEVDLANDYLRDNKIGFPTFFKGDQSLKFVSRIFPNWSGAVPASLLLGPDLKILDAWEGDSSYEELEQRVSKHLKGS